MSWRIANDKFLSEDKIFHLFRDAIIFYILHLFFINIFAALLTEVFAILWEVKDGLIPWEKFVILMSKLVSKLSLPYSVQTFILTHLNPGGDGFSYKDILAGLVGVVILLSILGLI